MERNPISALAAWIGGQLEQVWGLSRTAGRQNAWVNSLIEYGNLTKKLRF